MRAFNSDHSGQGGFTLAEMLVSVAIIGLIMAGLLSVWMSGNTAYLTGANQVEAQENARMALERMTQEIRGAGYDPRCNPPVVPCINPIEGPTVDTTPAVTSFMVQSDLNADGDIVDTFNPPGVCNPNTPGEQIVYALNVATGQLMRNGNDGCGNLPLIGGVQALTFTYFDANGAQLNVPPNPVPAASVPLIRSIQINLTTQPQNLPGSWQSGQVAVVMNDLIRLRNR